jgi:hypothetical protein
MLGQLAGQDEAHSGLDLARGHCGLLVVAGQLGGLSGNFLEDVCDEGVQDGNGSGGDTSVRVDLQDVQYSCQALDADEHRVSERCVLSSRNVPTLKASL